MCGIAGLLGVSRQIADEAAPRMLSAMRHRGPDDQGVERVEDPTGQAPPAVLVHARLAILDLTPAGHQPMADRPDGAARPNWVVFNGEIFNYRELYGDLAAAGLPPRTSCDTEVILYAYRAWGEDCVARM